MSIMISGATCKKCKRTFSHPWGKPSICKRCLSTKRVGTVKVRHAAFELIMDNPGITHEKLYNVLYKRVMIEWDFYCEVLHNMKMQGLLRCHPDNASYGFGNGYGWFLGDGESWLDGERWWFS